MKKTFVLGLILSSLFTLGYAGGPTGASTGFPSCCNPPSNTSYPCANPDPDGSWAGSPCRYGCQTNCGDAGDAILKECKQGCSQYIVSDKSE